MKKAVCGDWGGLTCCFIFLFEFEFPVVPKLAHKAMVPSAPFFEMMSSANEQLLLVVMLGGTNHVKDAAIFHIVILG